MRGGLDAGDEVAGFVSGMTKSSKAQPCRVSFVAEPLQRALFNAKVND
jgi:hypothetical protein